MKYQWGGGILNRKNPKGLQRFNKNQKQKRILIGSIVAILFIIGGISLYRSFAIYKVEKTFDVLQGTVPDFSKTKTYTEKLLNGADPVLDEKGELVPIKIGDNGIVTKADTADEWYSYEKKEWANAVILTEEGKKKKIEAGDKIDETDIESYFVWIPKYRYKIQTMGASSQGQEKAFEIEFGLTDTVDDESKEEYKQCKTPMNDERTQGLSGGNGNCHENYWMTHPAFISFKANGLWVGKFETGSKKGQISSEQVYDVNNVVIKPNQYSYNWMNVSNQFQASFNYKRELDSHMMKNTEWGAVAYLTQSIYGRCNHSDNDTTTCENMVINNNSYFVTGYASIAGNTTTVSQAITPGNDGTNTVNYFNNKSILASTTGNYTGIYDMNGGAVEYMMSPLSLNGQLVSGIASSYNSGFNGLYTEGGSLTSGVSFPSEKKYYDVYTYGTTSSDTTAYNRRILGDATAETAGWYGSRKDMSNSGWPWFGRGIYSSCGTQWFCLTPTIFTMGYIYGHSNSGTVVPRIVLSPQKNEN